MSATHFTGFARKATHPSLTVHRLSHFRPKASKLIFCSYFCRSLEIQGEISSGQSDSSCSPPLADSGHPDADMNITAMSSGSVKNDPNSSPGQELYSSPGPTSLPDTWTASVECNGKYGLLSKLNHWPFEFSTNSYSITTSLISKGRLIGGNYLSEL